ncbi:MAG: hypothetical protein KGM17_08385 [Sphingomonadales bacterium]|nr:hypothetical protein [Sphingomonadales bacterium]
MALRLPLDNTLIARIARKGGGRLIDSTVTQLLPEEPGRFSLSNKLVGAALVRIASCSVPGAILVGGGLLARAVHRKRQQERAAAKSGTKTRAPGA